MGVSHVLLSTPSASVSCCELVGRSGEQMWFPVTPGRNLAGKLCGAVGMSVFWGAIATHCVTLTLFQHCPSQSSRHQLVNIKPLYTCVLNCVP